MASTIEHFKYLAPYAVSKRMNSVAVVGHPIVAVVPSQLGIYLLD
nr:hypothetical protein [Lucifera butyrica]